MHYRKAQAVRGTVLDDDATTGDAGEFLSAQLLAASATALTTATAKTITSLDGADILTPGDWDVDGTIGFIPTATTNITVLLASLSLTTNVAGTFDAGEMTQDVRAASVPGANAIVKRTPTKRYKVASGTTQAVHLVAAAVFTVSTMTAAGQIRARRVR